MSCFCGEDDCPNFDCGHPWCRPCGEHHRAPECTINEAGQSLAWCGCPWDEIFYGVGHIKGCRDGEDDT